ncbi:MAG: hypothetical protein U1D55_03460 [Phycisphaerae bacterium]
MTRNLLPRLTAIIIAALAASVAGAQAVTEPALSPEVDRILTRMEERKVDDLRAEVTWETRFTIDDPDEAAKKVGELWFQDGKPAPRFMARFKKKISGKRVDNLDEQHLFDGFWFTERDGETKSVTKRQVRRADDPMNPYKIGQGTFPLPFGQKKADILREFDVKLEASGADAPENTDHLRLMPRADSDLGRIYGRVEFWVAREGKISGLPVKVRAEKRNGTGRVDSVITVTFGDAQLNQGLSSSMFKIDVPPGFDFSEEPLPDENAPAGGTEKKRP